MSRMLCDVCNMFLVSFDIHNQLYLICAYICFSPCVRGEVRSNHVSHCIEHSRGYVARLVCDLTVRDHGSMRIIAAPNVSL